MGLNKANICANIIKLIHMANINVKVKRREKDSSFTLLHRFQKKMQESGVLPVVRKKRFNKRADSRAKIKKEKLRKLVKTAEYERLKRLGMLIRKPKKRR